MEKHVGWDFFIPNDLTVNDFTGSIKTFVNEFLISNTNTLNKYEIPLIFGIDMRFELFEEFKIVVNGDYTNYTYKFVPVNQSAVDKDVDYSETIKNLKVQYIKILPGSRVLIPSGIHVNLPKNVFLNAENKSGIASKRGLLRGACLIDNDYQRRNSYKSFKSNKLYC